MMEQRQTRAGHDPNAVSILAGVMKSHVEDPFSVAVDVFATLHDAGLRVIAEDDVEQTCPHCGRPGSHRFLSLLEAYERQKEAVQIFLDYEDTHEPGPFVKDGNWHSGAEKIAPDGFQICADEDCGAYWPCPTEQLRRAIQETR